MCFSVLLLTLNHLKEHAPLPHDVWNGSKLIKRKQWNFRNISVKIPKSSISSQTFWRFSYNKKSSGIFICFLFHSPQSRSQKTSKNSNLFWLFLKLRKWPIHPHKQRVAPVNPRSYGPTWEILFLFSMECNPWMEGWGMYIYIYTHNFDGFVKGKTAPKCRNNTLLRCQSMFERSRSWNENWKVWLQRECQDIFMISSFLGWMDVCKVPWSFAGMWWRFFAVHSIIACQFISDWYKLVMYTSEQYSPSAWGGICHEDRQHPAVKHV